MSGNQENQELNQISHDPEKGPWMTRDRRGRARREEEVMGNPPVSGPAGNGGKEETAHEEEEHQEDNARPGAKAQGRGRQ